MLLIFIRYFVSETYAGEVKNAIAKLVLRSRDYIAQFNSVATDASREILLCGAENHITGKFSILISLKFFNKSYAYDICCKNVTVP